MQAFGYSGVSLRLTDMICMAILSLMNLSVHLVLEDIQKVFEVQKQINEFVNLMISLIQRPMKSSIATSMVPGQKLALREPSSSSSVTVFTLVSSSQAVAEKLIASEMLMQLVQCKPLVILISKRQSVDPIPCHLEFYILQLVTCVLISLGSASGLATWEVNPKSPTIRSFSLINTQQEMIMACTCLVMLTSSIGNQELLLITRILRKDLPAVGTQEIMLSTDFNAIDIGILVMRGSQVWMNIILLETELEQKNVP
ncbi:hypothetical protein VP01_6349g1 [Puccinia sorghi]|uniref:Uncharacterized protein n=1 Tax=Puccinia sorghi TaxID=27349 RepID=A0A0L6UG36_9BASI|nr:hypothetical protein VP01_6349g1 [Puccinia sorghi]